MTWWSCCHIERFVRRSRFRQRKEDHSCYFYSVAILLLPLCLPFHFGMRLFDNPGVPRYETRKHRRSRQYGAMWSLLQLLRVCKFLRGCFWNFRGSDRNCQPCCVQIGAQHKHTRNAKAHTQKNRSKYVTLSNSNERCCRIVAAATSNTYGVIKVCRNSSSWQRTAKHQHEKSDIWCVIWHTDIYKFQVRLFYSIFASIATR